MVSTVTPLRYPGGKSRLVPFVENLVEDNGIKTFIEPFCGGGGVGFSLLLSGKVEKLVINDLDKGIFAFWWAVLNETESLVKLVKETPITLEK